MLCLASMKLRALLPGIRDEDLTAAAADVVTPTHVDLASPLAPVNNLARVLDGVVFADVFGREVLAPITRAEALAVPAVARARHIIAGTVARIPLRAYRGGKLLDPQPAWINNTGGQVSAYHRALMTADDLLFYGWSCWSKVNGSDRQPLRMDRIAYGRWSVDKVGRVYVEHPVTEQHVLVDQSTVQLIPGPHEGLLHSAATTIRHAADLQRAASMAARHPAAYLVLSQQQGTPLKYESTDATEVTVSSTLKDWRAAREAGGGVGFLPLGLKAEELGTFDKHLVTEGRNAAAVDVARVCSLPADLLDAAGESSLTYANSRDNDVRAIQYGVGLYLSAISAVLSQDSVTPHGQEVRFDLEDWLEDPIPASASQPSRPAPAIPSTEEPSE